MQQILHSKRMRCDDVWPPAVDTDVFNPRFKSQAMREKLTWGHPDQPLILYVGRVAKEKSMEIMLNILEAHPQCYLALVGAGPDMDKWLVHHSAERHIFCSKAHWSGEALSQGTICALMTLFLAFCGYLRLFLFLFVTFTACLSLLWPFFPCSPASQRMRPPTSL